jgi:hypothetical protein
MAAKANKPNASADAAPADIPQTIPKDIGFGHPEYHFVESLSAVNRTLGILETKIEALKESSSSAEIKQEIRDLKSDLGKIRDDMHSSKVWILSIFGAGFILLLFVFSNGYFRLADRAEKSVEITSDMRVQIQKLVDAIPPHKR